MVISFQAVDALTEPQGQDPISLAANVVHLWGMELNAPRQCVERCFGWLDEGERHRATRLVREQDQRHYVLAHGGLRAILSRYLGISPGSVALGHTETGKPFVTTSTRTPSTITFSLSHAHGRALIAVSHAQEVGVDLELVRADIDAEQLSERYFSPFEHTIIMRSTDEERARTFFHYWVAKEAVVKMLGIGLRGLTSCEIVLGMNEADANAQVRVGSPFPPEVRVRFLSCGKGWEAAVAAQDLDIVGQGGEYDLTGSRP